MTAPAQLAMPALYTAIENQEQLVDQAWTALEFATARYRGAAERLNTAVGRLGWATCSPQVLAGLREAHRAAEEFDATRLLHGAADRRHAAAVRKLVELEDELGRRFDTEEVP